MTGTATPPVRTAPPGAAPAAAPPSVERLATAGYVLLMALSTVFSVAWLAIGATVAVSAHTPGYQAEVRASAAGGDRWAQGLLTAAARAEPGGQAVLDYAFSALGLVLAAVLLAQAHRDWVARLLALAMVGSAGAFNLQAHGATAVVETATGLPIGQAHQIQLHGIACAAYVLALLLFPTGRWRSSPDARGTSLPLAVLVVASLLVVGVGTALLPHTVSCILFFGFAVPLVGLGGLVRRGQDGGAELRARSRLMFSALLGAFGTIVVLGMLTGVLAALGQPGLTLLDPTAKGAHPQPTALLFWFARLAAIAVAAAALVATRRGTLWSAERVFSRGLASILTVVLVGGGWVVVKAAIERLADGPTAWAPTLATAASSLAFLPLYQRVEQLVERLLYGHRPTPYRVLADIAALAGTQAGGPNLAAVTEAIGRAMGATSCQLNVRRPGLRDRTYSWDTVSGRREWNSVSDTDGPPPDHLVLPIRQGEERIGAVAVDRGAVLGLRDERRHLLEDVADSLGAILQASRLGIELERQLRAALAHAEEIAVSRRAAVAEMDSERRAIERDLHDGAQHHLVTLRLALGLVEHQVSGGDLAAARAGIGELAERLATAESVLAKTATGVSSIVLAEQGLVSALRTDLAGAQPPVTVHAEGAETLRFPVEVETAVYFCCLESVNNARKHAGGAPVALRVWLADDALRFTVSDSGPGFDLDALSGSAGRGMRNLASRLTGVGGRLEVDSAPGAGTTVRGLVPLAQAPTSVEEPEPSPTTDPAAARREAPSPAPTGTYPAPPTPTASDTPSPGPGPTGRPTPELDSALLRQVREVLDSALRHSAGRPEAERLQQLRGDLAAPLRVGVIGPPGAGTTTLACALAEVAPASVLVTDLSAAPGEPVDALVALLWPGAPNGRLAELAARAGVEPRSLTVLCVLTRADEICGQQPEDWDEALAVAASCGQDPDLAVTGQPVTPVIGALALATLRLSDDDLTALAALGGDPDRADDTLLERLGPFGVRVVAPMFGGDGHRVEPSAGPGVDRAAVTGELARASGLAWLADALGGPFGQRAQALRARTAMLSLEDLLRRAPDTAESVLFELERLRVGAHELAELELAEALTDGSMVLLGSDREAALRLLGTADGRPSGRLGLPADASTGQVRAALIEELTHWRRQAIHPAATSAVRRAAEVLVRTCEALVGQLDEPPSVGR